MFYSLHNSIISLVDIKIFLNEIKFETKRLKQKYVKDLYKLSCMKSALIKRKNFIIRKLLFPLSGMKGIALLKRMNKI